MQCGCFLIPAPGFHFQKFPDTTIQEDDLILKITFHAVFQSSKQEMKQAWAVTGQ